MSDEFKEAAEEKAPSLVAEMWAFMRENKKWWLTPIVIAILLLGVLVIAGGSGAAPFIYTLF